MSGRYLYMSRYGNSALGLCICLFTKSPFRTSAYVFYWLSVYQNDIVILELLRFIRSYEKNNSLRNKEIQGDRLNVVHNANSFGHTRLTDLTIPWICRSRKIILKAGR